LRENTRIILNIYIYIYIVDSKGMFVLAFVVEFEVGYNPFMYKTQPQKVER
jgi:hypothetical protein